MTEGNPRLFAKSPEDVTAAIADALRQTSAGAWRLEAGTVLGGSTQLFGRLAQIIINRLNEAPEQHFRAFLNEAEVDRLPPRPARSEVTFQPAADGPAIIAAPAGTQVATRPSGGQPALIFETERAITVTPAGLVKCVAVDPVNFSDRTRSAQGEMTDDFAAFVGEAERERILYIGERVRDDPAHDSILAFPAAVDRRRVTVSVLFSPASTPPDAPAPDPTAQPWSICWRYFDGKSWRDLATAGATIAPTLHWLDACGGDAPLESRVDFTNLPDLMPAEVNGVPARWIAAHLTGGATRACLPEVRDIRIERTIAAPDAQPASINAAFAAIQGGKVFVPLDLGGPFQPFGPQPGALDTFYLRIDDALSKDGATVTLDLALPDLPDGLADTSEIDRLQIVWEYYGTEGWQALGYSRRGCPALEHLGFDLAPTPFPKPTLETNFFTRQKYLEFAVPPELANSPLPPPFNAGKPVTDIYSGKQYVQFPIPDGCKDLEEALLINGCYTSAAEALHFKDKTCALTTAGKVQFRVPGRQDAHRFAPTTVNGQEGYWLRARLAEGSYNVPRSIRRILNTRIDLPPEIHAPVITQMSVVFANYTVTLGPVRAEECFSKTDADWRNVRADLDRIDLGQRESVRPFTSRVEQQALYAGFLPLDPAATRAAFPAGAWLELRVAVSENETIEMPPRVAYQYWNGKEWRLLRTIDGTDGLRRTGYLGFFGPDDHQASAEFGQRAWWLRVIPASNASAAAPRLGTLLLNTVPVINAESIEREVLGSSNGEKDQRFVLSRAPVLPDAQIEVLERDAPADGDLLQTATPATNGTNAPAPDHSTWVTWQRVDSLYGAGPESRCYVLDQASGAVHFGDGRTGKIPPPGIDNIRATRYHTHTGLRGNTVAGAITELRSAQGPLGNVDRVANRELAVGGYDVEPIDGVKRRGPQAIKHRGRAVTQEDYQWLTLEAQGIARVYPLATTNANGQQQAGWVTLVVVPAPVGAVSSEMHPAPSRALLSQVRQYVEARALLNLGDQSEESDGLWLRGPEYVEVSVSATIIVRQAREADAVKLAVLAQIEAFLHPLTGGPQRTGWVLGRDVFVSEVATEIENVAGVDHVAHIGLAAPTLQLWQIEVQGDAARYDMPAGSQVSLIDERVKLILAEPLARNAQLTTLAAYGFKRGDAAFINGLADAAPALQVRLAAVDPGKETVVFDRPLDAPLPTLTPTSALQTLDGRIRLPLSQWQTATGDDGVTRAIGASVRTLAQGDLVSLVHAHDRGRIQFPVRVERIASGVDLPRIFVPASHLVCSGVHSIQVSLEEADGDPAA